MEETRFALLPVYILLESSISPTPFETAFRFVHEIFDTLSSNTAVANKLRLEVITFGTKARTVFPLGTCDQFSSWLEDQKAHPLVPDGGSAFYGHTFEYLKTRIAAGVQQIKSETAQGGEHFVSYRPVVFFITEGEPGDDDSARNKAYQSLTDPSFKERPTFFCFGVGEATKDKLKPYGAGRYNMPDRKYSGGNRSLVFSFKEGDTPAAALRNLLYPFIGFEYHCCDNLGEPHDPFPEDIGSDIDWSGFF